LISYALLHLCKLELHITNHLLTELHDSTARFSFNLYEHFNRVCVWKCIQLRSYVVTKTEIRSRFSSVEISAIDLKIQHHEPSGFTINSCSMFYMISDLRSRDYSCF